MNVFVTEVYLNPTNAGEPDKGHERYYQYDNFPVVPRIGEAMSVLDRSEGIDFDGTVEKVSYGFERRSGTYDVFFVVICLRGKDNQPRPTPEE